MLAKRASGQEKQRRILDIMLAKQAAGQEQQRRKPDIMLAECAAGQETTNTHTNLTLCWRNAPRQEKTGQNRNFPQF